MLFRQIDLLKSKSGKFLVPAKPRNGSRSLTMTKIWFISDTHNRHEELSVPADVDAVIHCGDEASTRKSSINESESRAFFDWYAALPIPTKLFVPGNHSIAIERGRIQPSEYPGVQFLIHRSCEFQGMQIFGSPYTPWFFGWAYNVTRKNLKPYWEQIPTGVEILATHGPPKGILDVTRDWKSGEPIHIGSLSLTNEVANRIRPRLHAFGHLHDEKGIQNFGSLTRDGTQFLNCSCCNLRGELVNHGQVEELEPPPSKGTSQSQN